MVKKRSLGKMIKRAFYFLHTVESWNYFKGRNGLYSVLFHS